MVHCGSGADQPDFEPVGMTEDENRILSTYHQSFNDDGVDYDLIQAIIGHIQSEFEVRYISS